MGESTGRARQHVVNLADYRAARAARIRPLREEPAAQPEASPASAAMPARPLLPRQIEHRERMLRHLAGG